MGCTVVFDVFSDLVVYLYEFFGFAEVELCGDVWFFGVAWQGIEEFVDITSVAAVDIGFVAALDELVCHAFCSVVFRAVGRCKPFLKCVFEFLECVLCVFDVVVKDGVKGASQACVRGHA